MRSFRIIQAVPDPAHPCGISDYAGILAASLHKVCECRTLPYAEAFAAAGPDEAVLLHYERSLLPQSDAFLKEARRIEERLFVVPHEVYAEDPFAYPYSALKAPHPWLLGAKRAWYRWRHGAFTRELALRKKGYGARLVFPLNGPAADVLRVDVPASRLGRVIPLIVPPPGRGVAVPPRDAWVRAAVFGFLTPATDYGLIWTLLEKEPRLQVLLLGGDRQGGSLEESLLAERDRRGMKSRLVITGYLQEASLPGWFAQVDLFLAPFKFKSSTGSLMHLLHLEKPVLAQDLPLTRWLVAEGAPLLLCRDSADWLARVSGFCGGTPLDIPPLRYPWSPDRVAEAYVEAMREALAGGR